MSRKFIATILAAAITITGISTQTAQAGNRDLERFLLGATALVIIGAAINNSNKRKHQVVTPQPVYPRPLPGPVARKLLPAECERTAWSRDGRFQVFPARCLQRNYRHAGNLPQECAGNYRFGNSERDRRPAYTKQCLVRYGYRVSRG